MKNCSSHNHDMLYKLCKHSYWKWLTHCLLITVFFSYVHFLCWLCCTPPRRDAFSNPQLNDEIYLNVSFLRVYLWLVTCLIPRLTCELHYFLSSLLHIHLTQTAIVKYNISWSRVVYDWVSFHRRFRFQPYSPITKQLLFAQKLNCFWNDASFSSARGA